MKLLPLPVFLLLLPLSVFATQDISPEQSRLRQAMHSALDSLGRQTTVCDKKEQQKPEITAEDLKPFDQETISTALMYFKNESMKACIQQQEYEYMLSMIAYAGSFPESARNGQDYQTVIDALIVLSPGANPAVVKTEGKFLALPAHLQEKLKQTFQSKTFDLEFVLNYYDTHRQAIRKP
ncbi:Uncharacterised protein [Campylobacter jejuni]|nr:Uncharacterised protein [Campylobacter jejuni]